MKGKGNTTSQTVRTCDVFISYRRDGGDMTAMYFYQALRERGYRVFYDLEVLRAGKFNEALLDSIQSCKDFVLILSPHALDRCDDPNDWVRREIAEALRAKKNIVPVMLKGFAFPEKLPEEIDDIRYQNGLTCTTEYFEESINRLCDRYLNSLPAQASKKRSPLIPVLAVIAALAVAFGGYMAFKGSKSPAPTPEPTATVEITAAPTATAVPTATPTPEPTDTPEPTEAPGPKVVKDTDFPALCRSLDAVPGPEYTDDTEAGRELWGDAPFFDGLNVRRRDVKSILFLPSLDGALADAVDVSDAGDGRVLAWAAPNGELYDLTIAGDGGVKILESEAASLMFSYFYNLESVNFNNCVDLSGRTDLSHMFWWCYNLKSVDFAGVYTGNATYFGLFGGCRALESVDLSMLDTSRVESFEGMFLDCVQLQSVDLSGFDTSRAVSMASMFFNCPSLRSLDLSGFDTSRVTSMKEMFAGCEQLTDLNISGFNTAWVRTFDSMFENCRSLRTLDVSGFDTSRAESFARMFADCRSLDAIDVSGFDTSRLEWMPGMFYGCERLRFIDVSGFDTSRVTGMFDLFRECMDLEQVDVSHFDTSKVEDMGRMFFECNHLEEIDVSGFDTSRCTRMDFMFAVTPLRQVDVSGFNTGNVRLMDRMFMSCPELECLDLSGWDVSSVEDMQLMFMDCRALKTIGRNPAAFARGNTVDMYKNCASLPGADATPPVKDTDFPALIRGMDVIEGVTELDDDADRAQRGDAPAFNLPNVRRRDVASVTFQPTLEGAPADAVDVSEAGDGRVLAWAAPNGELYDLTIAGDGGVKVLERDGSSPMFSYFFNLEKVDFNGCVDFSERTDFSRLFWCCHNLKEADLDGVYTGSAFTFSGLFGGCWALESLDVSMFDTSAAEYFDGMFLDCSVLPAVDVSLFDTARARVTESMFVGCETLTALDLSRWDVSNVEDMTNMFRNCRSLEGIGRDPAAFGHGRTGGMYDGCDHLKIN